MPVRNARFFVDLYAVGRPSFSANGFDCAGGDCGDGLGMKQILERVYTWGADESMTVPYETLLDLAASDAIYTPSPSSDDRGAIGANTVVLQARAFVALVTYLAEQNGYAVADLNACTGPDLPSHSVALARLKEVLLNTGSWRMNDDTILDSWLWGLSGGFVLDFLNGGGLDGPDFAAPQDAYKWTSLLPNVTRALDFYLALENAYSHYGDADYGNINATRLLSRSQKGAVFAAFNENIDLLEEMGGERVFLEAIHGVDAYDVQAGNWPLEVQLSIGYAILGTQNPNAFQLARYPGWATRAFKATGKPCATDRSCYWFYMSKGKRFWAEGPYYLSLMAEAVVPFWHAARINGFLDNTTLVGYNAGDPFRSGWFLNPYRWLADIATPDGRTPPIDDANKRQINEAVLLRWQGQYGDAAIGQAYAGIGDSFVRVEAGSSVEEQPAFARISNVLPVELAIPRLRSGQGTPPPSDYGNTYTSQPTEDSAAPLIVRRSASGHKHYVLLNGESGAAVERGEGHEQGDQLQLLYYVDGVSYLIDSGYDSGSAGDNSTWNHYYDHNVPMVIPMGNTLPNEGGILAPATRIFPIPPRKWSGGMESMDQLYRRSYGSVDVLSGEFPIQAFSISGNGPYHVARARRKVLFINDEERPYLVDLNWTYHDPDAMSDPAYGYRLRTSYHIGTAASPATWDFAGPTQAGSRGWIYRNLAGDRSTNATRPATNSSLVITPYRVELPQRTVEGADQALEQYTSAQDNPDEVRHLAVLSEDPRVGDTWMYEDYQSMTTATFLEAFPDTATPQGSELTTLAVPLEADPSAGYFKDLRTYSWKRAADVVDVLAVRSALAFTGRRAELRRAHTFAVPDAEGTEITFPATSDYGFARLRNVQGRWLIDQNYKIGLIGPGPLSVTIAGPERIVGGETYTWSARHTGGVAPYTRRWQYMDVCPVTPDPPTCSGNLCESRSAEPFNSEVQIRAEIGELAERVKAARPNEQVVEVLRGPNNPYCNTWREGGTGTSFTRTMDAYVATHFRVKLTATDASGDSRSSSRYYAIYASAAPDGGDEARTADEDGRGPAMLRTEALPEQPVLQAAYPNPFADRLTLRYGLAEDGPARLALYDVLGREVARVGAAQTAGYHEAALDASALPAGVYVVRFEAGGAVESRRVTLVR